MSHGHTLPRCMILLKYIPIFFSYSHYLSLFSFFHFLFSCSPFLLLLLLLSLSLWKCLSLSFSLIISVSFSFTISLFLSPALSNFLMRIPIRFCPSSSLYISRNGTRRSSLKSLCFFSSAHCFLLSHLLSSVLLFDVTRLLFFANGPLKDLGTFLFFF